MYLMGSAGLRRMRSERDYLVYPRVRFEIRLAYFVELLFKSGEHDFAGLSRYFVLSCIIFCLPTFLPVERKRKEKNGYDTESNWKKKKSEVSGKNRTESKRAKYLVEKRQTGRQAGILHANMLGAGFASVGIPFEVLFSFLFLFFFFLHSGHVTI